MLKVLRLLNLNQPLLQQPKSDFPQKKEEDGEAMKHNEKQWNTINNNTENNLNLFEWLSDFDMELTEFACNFLDTCLVESLKSLNYGG